MGNESFVVAPDAGFAKKSFKTPEIRAFNSFCSEVSIIVFPFSIIEDYDTI